MQEVSGSIPLGSTKFWGKMRILVLGGSQGAKRINDVVSQWVLQYALADEVELRHQTGVAQFSEISNRYKQSDVVVDVVEFIDDIDLQYVWFNTEGSFWRYGDS